MRITFDKLKATFKHILLQLSFTEEKAEICATLFAENSRDGVYSHGANRFPVFVDMVRNGFIRADAEPSVVEQNGFIEHWDGNLGPGMYNARLAMQRAIELSKRNRIGLITIKNSNHWMRGGSYGWQAADAGCIGICSSNTIGNMPPWGGKEARLGNNPLVIAVPHSNGHIVLDMAISQYSYGALQEYKLKEKKLPVPGGYDVDGNLSYDPKEIYKSMRALPIGYWKGSGLSLILDILLTALTGGRSVKTITESSKETGLSQFFICIYQENLHEELISEILEFTKSSAAAENSRGIFYPGENTLITRKENTEQGIPVEEVIWNKIVSL